MPSEDELLEEGESDFSIWLQYGLLQNWITEPFCTTHDGDPFMTPEETQMWDEGGDPCCHVLKLIQE